MTINNRRVLSFAILLKQTYHKYGLGHIILLSSYIIYILCFGAAFYWAESTQSTNYFLQWQHKISINRQKFIKNELLPEIFNNSKLLLFIHDHKSQYMTQLLDAKLNNYEKRLRLKPPMPVLKCTFTNSLLYAFSAITTIGYSYIYPVTKIGRVISIGFSTFGIPFTIVVIKDVEYLLVKILSYPCIIFVQLWHMFRFCTLQSVSEIETEERLDDSQLKHNPKNYRVSTAERLLLMPITVIVMALIGWISIGCLLCHLYNPNVDVHLLVYFVFNSLSTIGVGGIDLGDHPLIFAALFFYLLCGLSIISVFINLMHTKFSRQYWLPGNAYMPLLQRNRIYDINAATIESFNDEDQSYAHEPQMYRYTTLGIFQSEERCSVIQEIRKSKVITDATTQTRVGGNIEHLRSTSPKGGLPPIPQVNESESHDDVTDLLFETYVSRPPRLIYGSSRTTTALQQNQQQNQPLIEMEQS